MNVRETSSIRVTPAPKKFRKQPGFWNDPVLFSLIKDCVRTGKQQCGELDGSHFYAIVTPGWPFRESAMTPKLKDSLVKVRIRLLSPAFTMRVEHGDTEDYPFAVNGKAPGRDEAVGILRQ